MAKEFNIQDWQKKHLNEQAYMGPMAKGFDNRFKKAMTDTGFSDDEQDDIMSRDINKSFPSEPGDEPNDGYKAARAFIDEFREITYKKLSQEDLDQFSKEMVLHFLDNTTAAAAAKIHFGKKGL
tara:strand:+ start:1717 stop:2088 length:372 start_codon:yes stop_codon:yes gene_type:complete